mmetsp:Transcript_29374/g.82079  ORF Transcript_29374/g.82079 Transcript_29374/m.82079 type:complete len:202 (+) Transcript_29374:77-682(+)
MPTFHTPVSASSRLARGVHSTVVCTAIPITWLSRLSGSPENTARLAGAPTVMVPCPAGRLRARAGPEVTSWSPSAVVSPPRSAARPASQRRLAPWLLSWMARPTRTPARSSTPAESHRTRYESMSARGIGRGGLRTTATPAAASSPASRWASAPPMTVRAPSPYLCLCHSAVLMCSALLACSTTRLPGVSHREGRSKSSRR